MQPSVSGTFKSYCQSGGRLYYRAVLTLTNGTVLNLDNDDFMQDSWEFQYDVCENNFEFAGAIPSQFKCTLNNLTGKFTDYLGVLNDSKIKTYMYSATVKENVLSSGLVTRTITKKEEYCWGEYILSYDGFNESTIDLTGVDKLSLLNVNMLEFASTLSSDYKETNSYPCSLQSFFNKVMTKWLPKFGFKGSTVGVPFYSQLATLDKFIPPTEFVNNITEESLTSSVNSWVYSLPWSSDYRADDAPLKYISDYDWSSMTILDFLKCVGQMFACFVYVGNDDYIYFQKIGYVSSDLPKDYIKDIRLSAWVGKFTHFNVENVAQKHKLNMVAANWNYTYNNVKYTIKPRIGLFDWVGVPVEIPKTILKDITNNETNYRNLTVSISDNPLIQMFTNSLHSYTYERGNYRKYMYPSYSPMSTATTSSLTDVNNSIYSIYFKTITSEYVLYALKNLTTIPSLEFRDIECTAAPLPHIWIGSQLTCHSLSGKSYKTLVSHITYVPNVKTVISSSYEEPTVKGNVLVYSDNADTFAKNCYDYLYPHYITKVQEVIKGIANNTKTVSAIIEKENGNFTWTTETNAVLNVFKKFGLGTWKISSPSSGTATKQLTITLTM